MSTFESAAQPYGVPGHASAPPVQNTAYPSASAPQPNEYPNQPYPGVPQYSAPQPQYEQPPQPQQPQYQQPDPPAPPYQQPSQPAPQYQQPPPVPPYEQPAPQPQYQQPSQPVPPEPPAPQPPQQPVPPAQPPRATVSAPPRPSEEELSLTVKAAPDTDEDDPSTGPDGAIGPTGRPKRHVPEPAMLQQHGPAKVLAICNQKGGVGKTTSTINLGAALTEFGRRVLLVDFDPQGALSVGLGIPAHSLDQTIYNVIIERSVGVDEVVIRTGVDDMDLLPSNIDLSAAEVQLVAEVGREHTLLRTLRPVLDRYDYILVDCQPSLGLLTVNALAAADGVLIPLECEFFSLRGAALLIDTIQKVRERLNPKLEITGILATMFDPRTLHSREVMARVVEAFGEIVFDTVINRTVRFPETTVAGEPITKWAPRSAGAKAYRALAREVIAR
jgi:chromosome partitioning protein